MLLSDFRNITYPARRLDLRCPAYMTHSLWERLGLKEAEELTNHHFNVIISHFKVSQYSDYRNQSPSVNTLFSGTPHRGVMMHVEPHGTVAIACTIDDPLEFLEADYPSLRAELLAPPVPLSDEDIELIKYFASEPYRRPRFSSKYSYLIDTPTGNPPPASLSDSPRSEDSSQPASQPNSLHGLDWNKYKNDDYSIYNSFTREELDRLLENPTVEH